MSIYQKLVNKETKLSIIGLGYVGMPIAVAFAEKVEVIGYDLNKCKIESYRNGIDVTNEVGNEVLANTSVYFTSDEHLLKEASFHIIAVPTPVKSDKTPDLFPITEVSKTIGRNLSRGSVVVYESTVYPGVTEDVCIPILEKESGLICGKDFKVGYSPERINPGDKVHKLENIVKIVSGIDEESLDEIALVYSLVIKAGVHKAANIKVAEAAKVVENSQRDINIAFMNELAMVFDKMQIDTQEVIKAMNTKWNALKFTPGLVGGHCISVDPYYFIYQAEQLGYHSQIIGAGRKINDGMSKYVVNNIIKKLILAGKNVKNSKVAILGLTFKENCPDTRNSKVIDIYKELLEYGIEPIIVDPVANKKEVKSIYNIDIHEMDDLKNLDCVIFAVAHNEFKGMTLSSLNNNFINGENFDKVIIDIKGIFDSQELKSQKYTYWKL